MPIRIDSITVDNEEEATKLMIHHLHIAALCFEATHDDAGERAKELILKQPTIEQNGMDAFVEHLVLAYKEFGE